MITLDGIIFSLQQHGGISVYFRELIKYLVDNEIETTLTLDQRILQEVQENSGNLHVVKLKGRHLERYRTARDPANSKVFHSSYYRTPARPNQASVVTVHDFTYERFTKGPALWAHQYQKHKAIKAAQAIICISEATKDDLLEFVGVRKDQNIYVIPNGVSETFHPLPLIEHAPRDLLFVGERRGYKNFRMLLEALAFLPDYRVQCVGGGVLRDDEFKGLPLGVRKRVTHLGRITDEELNKHYNRVAGLVYPSAYEGFGIPVIEAMRAGCPVIAIECKAVLEVGGAALIVSTENTPAALADAIDSTTDAMFRKNVISAGLKRAAEYSWQDTHKKTTNVYKEINGIQINP